ncbi:bifunctional demethylmenaquinone methyltransferase/2-methoxy-6-polyprenyl-1,4-benzoquinol methylase UbiE [Candidatus Endowatersipora endosymbiont of Watersipora subatra]|uniref:bifunctional demethylmenaquinone methyltransferase/2-methoxy-6-polyprenyl-1,4-benzoquinol methylase UbiE n=1 Tax=Candidatus Endowatersipora endosymbiont of Watersipora subatra TaxID=3077946 RepID=UPI00312C78CC
MKTTYGFFQVSETEKQVHINSVFHSVAQKYDLMNDLMSLGIHRIWKKIMVNRTAPSKGFEWQSLDVAGGTGDIAFQIVEDSNLKARVIVLDINSSMLEVGKKRAKKNGLDGHVHFVQANAEELPFLDNTFDAYTVAFGIRNIPRIDLALKEAYRVLKPGRQFLCLEFSQVQAPILDKIYESWSFCIIPAIAYLTMSNKDSYQYLIESIRKFPDQNTFLAAIENAGFSRVIYRNMNFGIATLYTGWKI